MGLLKASSAPTGLATFSMRDVEDQAKALLLRARQAAERLIAGAQREAAELKRAAHAQGLVEGRRDGLTKGADEGRAAGLKQALEEHRAQLTQAVAALTEAASDLDASRGELEAAALEEVVSLAIAIARRVTKRQALIEPQVLTDNLREAMRLVVGTGAVKVAIHPAQRHTLDSALPALRLDFPRLTHVEVVDDDSVDPGGCRIFAGGGQVEATLGEQLDRVVADLLPTEPRGT